MKKLVLVAVVTVVFGAWAKMETAGGYMWTYRISGDTACLRG